MISKDDLKKGLPERENGDLPDEITSICADLLRQYIEEDGIKKDDPNDVRLERLMRMSEVFFSWYMQVVDFNQEKGQEAVVQWVTSQNKNFIKHAEQYHELYSEVAHMSRPPYFVSSWAMAALVESAIVAYGQTGGTAYKDMTEQEKDELKYILRFGENLLQTFHTQVALKN